MPQPENAAEQELSDFLVIAQMMAQKSGVLILQKRKRERCHLSCRIRFSMYRYFRDVSYRDTEYAKAQTDERIHKIKITSQPVLAAPDHPHPGEKQPCQNSRSWRPDWADEAGVFSCSHIAGVPTSASFPDT